MLNNIAQPNILKSEVHLGDLLGARSALCFIKYAHLSGQALVNYKQWHEQTPPPPNTCTYSQHDRIAGVCIVREEKWAEIRSCDPPVCLRLYHSNLTAVILLKQRQMASGKVRKSLSLSLPLMPISIYVPMSASSYLSLLFSADWVLLLKQSS